jgi:RNA polymerase sigma factor (sigma-70 family)
MTRWEREYGPGIRVTLRARGIREHDVDDVKQDAWLKAWRVALRGTLPPFQSPEDEQRWLTTVAINAAYDRGKGRKCRDRHLANLIKTDKVRAASDPVAELERIKTTKAITAALESLDPSSKQVVEWRFFDRLTVREIAEKLRVHRNTVRNRIRESLQQLRTSGQLKNVRKSP